LLSERGIGAGPRWHSFVYTGSVIGISRTEFDLDRPDCSPVPDDFTDVIGGL
jgi:hypothetical protein